MDMGNKTPKNWDTQKIAKVFCLGIFCFVCGFFGGVVGDYSQLGEKSNSNSTASIVEPSIDDNQEGSNNTVPDTNDGNSNSENNNTFGNNDNDSSSSDENTDEDKAALGITVRTISNTEGYTDGVYIAAISDLSNADEAGLKVGDRIISADGNEISQTTDLSNYVQSKQIGDTITLVAERDGEQITAEVTLVSYQRAKAQSSSQKA